MKLPTFTPGGAILWGGLIAGTLDIAVVFAYWTPNGVPPTGILRAIAGALMGPAAYEGGTAAAALGLFLHFAVSFVFAATYVIAAEYLPRLKSQPVLYGVAYGLLAKLIMDHIVVPLSRADFGSGTPTLVQLALNLFIHLFMFGLPIALAASRVHRRTANTQGN